MTVQRYVHGILPPHLLPLMQRLPGAIFLQDNVPPHTARVSQDYLCFVTPHCCTFTACPIIRFVSNRAYLGSFETASWASHVPQRTRGNVTENMVLYATGIQGHRDSSPQIDNVSYEFLTMALGYNEQPAYSKMRVEGPAVYLGRCVTTCVKYPKCYVFNQGNY
ncbi:uncharacterized protein TNCV_1612521 [Trichonephila clavipes]|nr:uncharacterized protein TNCV_1612521 [Trichonephila clavipes]